MTSALYFGMACLAALAGLLVAERGGHAVARVVFKLLASSAFVALALRLDAPATPYGRWLLAALLLSWVGDACLLARSAAAFLAGLGSFLVAHLCFAAAFFTGALSGPALGGSLLAAVAAGALVKRWLGPHLTPADRLPVAAYIATILVMCAAAVNLGATSGHWWPAIAAVVFAVSDLSVARDQFIASGFSNKAWGLPAYYVAQWLMASSIAAGR